MAESQSSVAQPESAALEVGDFSTLLQKEFKPKTDEAKAAVEQAVRTLAEQALSQTQLIGSDVVKSISAIIAELDQKLSEQINQILHHSDFQQLEGAWRGLHYLVNNTETDEMLKIRFMNISKTDLGKTLKRYKGTSWDQSPLFKRIYEEEYGNSAASLSAVWWEITTSTTLRPMSNYWVRWPKSRRLPTHRSSPAPPLGGCRWTPGKSWPTPVI